MKTRFLTATLVGIVAVTASFVAFAPTSGAATTWYAYPNGTSSSTTSCPLTSTTANQCSLGRALTNAVSGDTIELEQGDFSTVASNGSAPFAVGTSVTIEADPNNTAPVYLDGANTTSVVTVASGVTATIAGVTIENGYSAVGTSGGGITNSGTLTLGDTTLQANTAQFGAGGVLNHGTLTVPSSTFLNNVAGSSGGAVLNYGTFTTEDSTYVGNSAASGGGVLYNSSSASVSTVTSSTIVAAAGQFNGVLTTGNGSLTEAGDVITGACVLGTVTDDGYNVVASTTCDSGAASDVVDSSLTSQLAAAANNGGPTETVALGAGNPAIGSIPNGTAVGTSVVFTLCAVIDQRGVASPAGASCDAGAAQLTVWAATVTGSQVYGGSPSFASTTIAPTGTTVAGSPSCTTADGGMVSISSTTSAGTYTIDGSSCSGLTLSGSSAVYYAVGYSGSTFVVNKASAIVQVSGSQAYGGSPNFTYTTSPAGVSVTSLACTTVNGGTTIAPTLSVASYTIDGSSCSSSANPDYTLSFTGVSNGFVVATESVTVNVTGSETYGSTPRFSYTTVPTGVSVNGLACSTVDDGEAIESNPALPGGSYTIDASSCGVSGYPNYAFTFTGGSFTVTPSAPQAPALEPPTPGSDRATLSWEVTSDGGSSLTGFDVFEGTSSGAEAATPVAVAPANVAFGHIETFTVTGLTNGTKYYFEVAAVNSVGTSSTSVEYSVTPGTVPSAPSGLVATPSGTTSISLAWSPPSNDGGWAIDGYNVFRSTSSSGPFVSVGGPEADELIDTGGLKPSTTYYYEVKASNGLGEGVASTEASATTEGDDVLSAHSLERERDRTVRCERWAKGQRLRIGFHAVDAHLLRKSRRVVHHVRHADPYGRCRPVRPLGSSRFGRGPKWLHDECLAVRVRRQVQLPARRCHACPAPARHDRR